jgi:formylglycine-generating enzyme required for sulfatase activity
MEIELVCIPPGTFLMGSPSTEDMRYGDEGPQHRVTLTRGFWMGVYPVTQGQWEAVMGSNPSRFSGANHPVEMVSWEDCQRFCAKLRRRTGKPFRLPTEAEWEYACRAGTTTAFHSGNDERDLALAGWYSGNSNSTQAVGQKVPNAWGLHDMHGNVFEWCQDWFAPYTRQDRKDPRGSRSGSGRVWRGGGWALSPRFCRAAYRSWDSPSRRVSHCGLRLCFHADRAADNRA